ncbi:hypothetical protein [Haloplanus salilacus]|uniref:hypothetical protein n=1 Tax=Haloplanus salilacus TaxID=2949994 RepID=UPI0030D3665B
MPSVRSASLAARAGTATRALAFWAAVALPVPALGLIAVGADLWVVFALLACNAVALVVGHDYRSRPRPNRDH